MWGEAETVRMLRKKIKVETRREEQQDKEKEG